MYYRSITLCFAEVVEHGQRRWIQGPFLRLKPGFNVTYLPFSLGGNGNGYYLNGTVANGYYDAEYSITIFLK